MICPRWPRPRTFPRIARERSERLQGISGTPRVSEGLHGRGTAQGCPSVGGVAAPEGRRGTALGLEVSERSGVWGIRGTPRGCGAVWGCGRCPSGRAYPCRCGRGRSAHEVDPRRALGVWGGVVGGGNKKAPQKVSEGLGLLLHSKNRAENGNGVEKPPFQGFKTPFRAFLGGQNNPRALAPSRALNIVSFSKSRKSI